MGLIRCRAVEFGYIMLWCVVLWIAVMFSASLWVLVYFWVPREYVGFVGSLP